MPRPIVIQNIIDQKRYGETLVAAADYFNQELIGILADNDVSLMGASLPH